MSAGLGFDAPVLINIERPDFSDAHLIGVQTVESASAIASVFREAGYRVTVRVWTQGSEWNPEPFYSEASV